MAAQTEERNPDRLKERLEDWDPERWGEPGKPKPGYVGIYALTRHYGGPEEGGWYYNWMEHLESRPIDGGDPDAIAQALEEEYAAQKYGNIYSVLDGQDIVTCLENEPGEDQSTERPHYE